MTYEEPEFLPWEGRSAPLTLLGGYLGSGKTTVINELLARSDRPIAVLVNDVGAVNVDAKLIRSRNSDTIEFTDGCVCCSLSGGLGAAFDQLRERPDPPEQVVLELSGVADPDRVRPWGHSAGFRLDGVVVLVDCDQLEELLQIDLPAAMLERQVRSADLLILTKTDLADTHRIEAARTWLAELAPTTPVLDRSNAIATAGILELGGSVRPNDQSMPAISLFDQHIVDLVPLPNPIELAELETLIDELDPTTLRAKGIARNAAGQRLLVQVVGRRRDIAVMPEGQDIEPTDLVVISSS